MSGVAKERKGGCAGKAGGFTKAGQQSAAVQVHARDSKSQDEPGRGEQWPSHRPAAAPVKHKGAVTAADQVFGGKQFLKY